MNHPTIRPPTHALARSTSDNMRLRAEDPEAFATAVEEVRTEVGRERWSRERRHSSIAAILVGDVNALLAKHAARSR